MKLPAWFTQLFDVKVPREPEVRVSIRVHREKTDTWEDHGTYVSKRPPIEVSVR